MSLVRDLYSRVDHLVHEAMKFGTVGAFAFVVNVTVFNLVHYALGLQPIRSKIIATGVATVFAYLGNRHWTYKQRDRLHWSRETTLFFLFNGVGMAIESGCLALSHYLLGLRGVLADNLSANVVGLALGTLFRFWAYRNWVFPEGLDDAGERARVPEQIGAGSAVSSASAASSASSDAPAA